MGCVPCGGVKSCSHTDHGMQSASSASRHGLYRGPSAVQLFIFDTLSWMSAIEVFSRSCSGWLLWEALRSTRASGLCDASLFHIPLQYSFTSALSGCDWLLLFPCHWEYTLAGSVGNSLFILWLLPLWCISLIGWPELLVSIWQFPVPQVWRACCTSWVPLYSPCCPSAVLLAYWLLSMLPWSWFLSWPLMLDAAYCGEDLSPSCTQASLGLLLLYCVSAHWSQWWILWV